MAGMARGLRRGVKACVVSRDETSFIVSRSLGQAVLQFRVRTDITDNRSRVSRASTLDCRPDGTGRRRRDHGLRSTNMRWILVSYDKCGR
jgi:hypothetical protein